MKKGAHKKDWTIEQKALLKACYATMTIEELSALLGRSKWAVHAKARELGLSKPHLKRFDGTQRGRPFVPGQDPWNKGQPYQAGGRSAETQFKPRQEPWNKGMKLGKTDCTPKEHKADPVPRPKLGAWGCVWNTTTPAEPAERNEA